jgi:hypothetical protein
VKKRGKLDPPEPPVKGPDIHKVIIRSSAGIAFEIDFYRFEELAHPQSNDTTIKIIELNIKVTQYQKYKITTQTLNKSKNTNFPHTANPIDKLYRNKIND